MKHLMSGNCGSVQRQSNTQRKQVHARVQELADTYGAKQGLGRREFLKTSSGMAAAFLAMNSVYGKVFQVSEAEAADDAAAKERAESIRPQFIFDVETYFFHSDHPAGREGQGINEYIREIFLGSDTSVAVLSGVPHDDDSRDPLSNAQIAEAARLMNTTIGHTVVLTHNVVTPGQPGWMEEVDRALAERPPASWKLYTIGDPSTPKTKHPFWLDDEKLMYPFYEKAVKAGILNMCVHKGPMPSDYEHSWPYVWEYQTPRDLVKAAADWPQLNFIIYNGCFRGWNWPDDPAGALADFDKTGRIEWCTDLAEIPARNGASNIYAELGPTFAHTAYSNPRLATAVLGTWVKGLGAANVVWGSGRILHSGHSLEILRRIEIPEDMQAMHGFAPLGPADGMVKNQIFGLNSARCYNLDLLA